MNYEHLKTRLGDPELKRSEMFDILMQVTHCLNHKPTFDAGRDLVIRTLARTELCDEFEVQILASLTRSVGLYPYLTDVQRVLDYEDILAFELHRPDGLDAVFHSLQARVYYELKNGSNVVLSASTSVGKSLLIDAMIALQKFKKIAIVVPTLALIDETRKRLATNFRNQCHLITHQSQLARSETTNVYILTQERVRQREDLHDVEFFAIDEFYKIDLKRDDDKQRAIELNLAFHQLASTGAQFYLLGPNVQAIRGLGKYDFHFISSNYSTVAVDVHQFNLPRNGSERLDKLIELTKTLTGPTLIYCQSPGSATKVARSLRSATDPVKGSPEAIATAAWMSENFHADWSAAEFLRAGIGLHHGSIPRAIQQHIVKLFNNRELRYLVCTSTLIEGVNTSAENVIIYDRRRSKSPLDHFTYKNIQGRAGRFRQYFIGKVFMLEKPPEDDDVIVDYPVGQQDMDTPLPLLLQLDEDSLSELSRVRVEEVLSSSILSADTLRLNSYIDPTRQNDLAKYLMESFERRDQVLLWRGFPHQPQLIAVCNLIYQFFSGPSLNNYGIISGPQLAWHLRAFSQPGGIRSYLRDVVSGRAPTKPASDAIDDALRIARNVIGFGFPRDLMALNRIVSEIANRYDLSGADYGVYAEAAESFFVPTTIAALDEYGVPLPIARKLQHYVDHYDLDSALRELRTLDLPTVESLTAFELGLLQSVQETL